ncbi:unnamed protein product [Prorocentrum cordatum]|uniref:t-SNARE coiled-coil homology domain-containing protein n=1 Tax=Prorocentrum cordatum TaxID=2364126 RepID=A0ABN9SH79_9DINO|nr:unnamed protein product [Polarella glacialis]
MEGISGPHYLQAVSELKAIKASSLAAKPWDQQRKSLHDQLDVTRKKLANAKQECDKSVETMVTLANEYEKQVKHVSDLTAEVQQLETQHQMAVQQALKEHVPETPTLESYITSQFPPGLTPSPEVQMAVAQLSAKLHEEWTNAQANILSQQSQAPASQGNEAPAEAAPGGGGGLSAAADAALDAEQSAMEEEVEHQRLAGIKRAGEALGQVLNLQGQNVSQTEEQQGQVAELQKAAKTLCVAAKGKGGKGPDGKSCG